MTPRRLRNLLCSLPITVGLKPNSSRTRNFRARASLAETQIVESLEQRIVLSTVGLNLSLVDDASVAPEVFDAAIRDGRTIQQTGRLGEFYLVTSDSVRVVELNADSFASDGASSGGSGGASDTGDSDLGAVISDAVDSAAQAVVQNKTLVDVDQLPDAVDLRVVTDLGDDSEGPRKDLTISFTYDSVGRIRSVTTTSIVSYYFEDNSETDSAYATGSVLVGPMPAAADHDSGRSVAVPSPSGEASTIRGDSDLPEDQLRVVVTVDPAVSDGLTSKDFRKIGSGLVRYVATSVRAVRPKVRGLFFSVKTRTPVYRRTSYVQTVASPVAKVQPITTATRTIVREEPGPETAKQDQHPERDFNRRDDRPRQSNATKPTAKYPQEHATVTQNEHNASTNVEALDTLRTTLRSSAAPSVSDTTIGAREDNRITSQSRTNEKSKTDSNSLAKATMPALLDVEVDDSLAELQAIARPEYAITTGPSGNSEKTTSGILDARLATFGGADSSPISIERPVAPAIQSPILHQLEYEQAPRGPPTHSAIAQGFELNRASELRLKLLRHSRAPRSPSVISAFDAEFHLTELLEPRNV